MNPTDIYEFVEEYDRLTAIETDDWGPDEEEDWHHLCQSAAHMLYESINTGF